MSSSRLYMLLALFLVLLLGKESIAQQPLEEAFARMANVRKKCIADLMLQIDLDLARENPDREKVTDGFDRLGQLRAIEGAGLAALHVTFSAIDPDKPIGIVSPTRQFPASSTLIEVGAPSVHHLLNELAEDHAVSEQVIWLHLHVVRMILPKDAAVTWVDHAMNDAAREGRQNLGSLKAKLQELPSELFGESLRKREGYRPPKPKGTDEPAYRAWAAAKQELLSTHLTKLGKASLWENQRDEAISIARIVGEYRLAEASPLLAPHLLVETPDAIEKDGTLARYPVAEALSKIGLSAVDPMLQQVIQGDEPEATRNLVARVLADMMPPEVAVTFVDAAIASQKNELAKQRLVDLRKTLNKLAEESKKKRENKD